MTADNPSVPQWGQSFLYDGFGNLTDKSVVKGSAPVWHGLADPATNRSSGYTYDGNGNAGVPYMQYGYDTENRLISQVAGVQSSQYQYGYGYDPDNRRVYKATGTYDPGSGSYPIVGEEITFWGATGQRMGTYGLMLDPGGNGYAPSLSLRWQNTERVYFGNRPIWGSGPVFTDRLGSIGKYFPYGEERPAATVGDAEKFATYFRESATGLDYAMNRYYDSGTGRFLTPDPYRATTGAITNTANPGSWNRYTYVSGDPVNRFDPRGLLEASPDVECGEGEACDDGDYGGESGGVNGDGGAGGGGGGPKANAVYDNALSTATSAAAAINEKTSWSSDCQGLLAKIGLSPEDLSAGAAKAQFVDGTTSSVLQASLYQGTAAQAGRSIDPNLTVAVFLDQHLSTGAEADLNGNRIFLRPNYFNGMGNLYAEGVIAHEVLHNLTGMTDDALQSALGLRTDIPSFNITIKLLDDCFSQ